MVMMPPDVKARRQKLLFELAYLKIKEKLFGGLCRNFIFNFACDEAVWTNWLYFYCLFRAKSGAEPKKYCLFKNP